MLHSMANFTKLSLLSCFYDIFYAEDRDRCDIIK